MIDHGDGPAVVMVHGNPTWSFLWRRVIAALGPDVRCIAPDLLGFGLSDKLPRPEDHSVELHVETLVAVVDTLGLDDFVLMGQDWGGVLAMGIGMHRSARVRGRVLGNTAVLPPRRPPRATSFHRLSQTWAGPLGMRAVNGIVHAMPRVQGDPASLDRTARRAYRWPFRSWSDRAGPLGLARMVPSRPGHPSLEPCDAIGQWAEGWSGPTAMVWGRRDPILGRTLRRHRERLDPGYVVTTDAGHFLQEEVPSALADAVRWVFAQG
jgi:haloalkane dehalogenase